ncbi:MAG TPA: biotin/lipoate A/B protein ligase family protein [Bacillota bacterium]|jgi:lipoate-protein ligase A|nr:biotin/lipoate A/B protein ligase family protein [Bacillota bacterium]HOB29667.1 biotin/lipoate A/B protein ligase family protein [Bacillota bacterium]HPZ42278.1 biotin/lipoate A/B protein ligase family protein [Bacillota bacterium]HQD53123.1 biotin/lipoate A/B protein ligase family protein [Bacillota bacterium]
MKDKWRLLYDSPMPGAANMQRDLEILKEVAAGEAPPTLRLYSWAPPALSIGRFQKANTVADLESCRRLGLDIVRRPTGGRAILHHQELTYCLVIPDQRALIPAGVVPAYRFISRALLHAFEILQIEAELNSEEARGGGLVAGSCFDTPSAYELCVAGKKVVGSAQLRREGMLLQHGSILLKLPLAIYRQVLQPRAGYDQDTYLASLAGRSAGLLDLRYKITGDELANALSTGFARLFNVEWGVTGGRFSCHLKEVVK